MEHRDTAARAIVAAITRHIGAENDKPGKRRERVAGVLNATPRAIDSYERGDRDAHASTLARWCNNVKMDLAYEFGLGWVAEVKA